jgi:hypothetical protein
MEILSGFEMVREQTLPELNSTARFYRHAKTGAELLSLVNDDENKVFGVTFRTPPRDSTGVAHILEHCGFLSADYSEHLPSGRLALRTERDRWTASVQGRGFQRNEGELFVARQQAKRVFPAQR